MSSPSAEAAATAAAAPLRRRDIDDHEARADRRRGRLDLLGVDVADRDDRALLEEALRDRPADPATRADHQRTLPVEPSGHRRPLAPYGSRRS